MRFMRMTLIYVKLTLKEMVRRPRFSTLYDCGRYFGRWRRSLKEGRSSVTEKIPWMAFGAIAFIERNCRTGMRVFEYGSGGSSLFWAARAQQLVSVEHDRAWYETLRAQLRSAYPAGIEYLLVEPEADPFFTDKSYLRPDDYVSEDIHYKGYQFERYVKTIDSYPDHYFDVIVVDGRARPSCIRHSIGKLKKGGLLVVDNTERAYYLTPFSWDKQEWSRRSFSGPIPFTRGFSETSIFTKLF